MASRHADKHPGLLWFPFRRSAFHRPRLCQRAVTSPAREWQSCALQHAQPLTSRTRRWSQGQPQSSLTAPGCCAWRPHAGLSPEGRRLTSAYWGRGTLAFTVSAWDLLLPPFLTSCLSHRASCSLLGEAQRVGSRERCPCCLSFQIKSSRSSNSGFKLLSPVQYPCPMRPLPRINCRSVFISNSRVWRCDSCIHSKCPWESLSFLSLGFRLPSPRAHGPSTCPQSQGGLFTSTQTC